MFNLPATFRAIITAGLILSFGLVEMSPPQLACFTNDLATTTDTAPARACCRGNKSAACCVVQLCCCASKTPDRHDVPLPREYRSELTVTLPPAVCMIVANLVEVPRQPTLGVDQESAVIGTRRHTLQALHDLLRV